MNASTAIPIYFRKAQEKAPPHPPCFGGQDEWVDYIAWAMASQDSAVRPIANHRTRRNEVLGDFSPAFDYCADCTSDHKERMLAADRCNRYWLIELSHKSPDKAAA